jgi:hypothetical protein
LECGDAGVRALAPFGVETTIVNPGFFRTKLLTDESTQYTETSISDCAERTAAQLASALDAKASVGSVAVAVLDCMLLSL